MTTIPSPNRLAALDIARTVALVGMVAFHIRFDRVMFGLAPPQITATDSFYWHARLVAGSFLFLAGVSLWLAHGTGLRWPDFWRRQIRLVAAAGLVSAATFLALPDQWVFFGILHSIALCSLLALPFLRLPAPVTLVAGAAVMLASFHLPEIAQWNHPALRWIGLQAVPTATIDLEPLVPWFGPLLLGLGLGRLLAPHWENWRSPASPALALLAWPGRHSLAIYLVHQPILLALFWTYVQFR